MRGVEVEGFCFWSGGEREGEDEVEVFFSSSSLCLVAIVESNPRSNISFSFTSSFTHRLASKPPREARRHEE